MSFNINAQAQKMLEEFQNAAARLIQLGWDDAQGGNLTMTAATPPVGWEARGLLALIPPESPGAVTGMLATVSGSRWREIADDPTSAVVYANLASTPPMLWSAPRAATRQPTSELPTHGRLHALRLTQGQPAGVVLHAHPPALLALALLPIAQCAAALALLPRMFPEAALLLGRGISLVPYHRPGSLELAQATVNAFTKTEIALWHKHGAISAAVSANQALDMLETAELAARAYWRFLSTGITPAVLTDQELAELTR
jgi:rhamnulose-1-phosphate aldolase